MFKKTLLSAAILSSSFIAGSASAAFMIDFDQQSAFLFDVDLGGGLIVPAPDDAELGVHGFVDDRVTGWESMWWPANQDPGGRGTESDASPIGTADLDNPTSPIVEVDGNNQGATSALKVLGQTGTLEVPEDGSLSDAEILSYVYHRNNPINGDSPVFGALVDSTLFSYNGDEAEDGNILPFLFDETNNNVQSENCPFGNPNGTFCDDLFLIPLAGFDPVPITLDGVKFLFEFNIAPGPGAVTNLEDCRNDVENCTFAETGDPELDNIPFFTVWTGEDQLNFLNVTVAARLAPVPTPATLAVLGLGLAGLGASMRKRKA